MMRKCTNENFKAILWNGNSKVIVSKVIVPIFGQSLIRGFMPFTSNYYCHSNNKLIVISTGTETEYKSLVLTCSLISSCFLLKF